jgi:phosphoglycolate phosphatase
LPVLSLALVPQPARRAKPTDMAIKGILFDKDGTLLDYEATWLPLNQRAAVAAAEGDQNLAARLLAAGGYDAASQRVRAGSTLAAGTNREIATCWAALLPGRGIAELTELVEQVYTEGGRQSATPVAELAPLLGRLKARRLRLGVATSDSVAGAQATLAHFGVIELLDFLAGYDSGHPPKPDPGLVDAFCRATGLAASEVSVVGDNLHDIEMGRAAGAGLVVGVLTGTGAHSDLAPRADHVLESIEELEALLDEIAAL